jgi:lysosomal acid lipase/cholesteryl ester hydrolase
VPVFFQHGLIDKASTFFFNPANMSAASILAQNCSNVWLGNSRGTVNSYLHVNLTTDDSEYWDHSFDEMGRYDVPANVEFILNYTNEPQLIYVGHSQGTTQFWLANILHDNLGSKIRAMAALAPVLYVGH